MDNKEYFLNDFNVEKQTKKLRFLKFKFFLISLCILGLIVSYGCQRKKGIRSPYDSTPGRTNRQSTPEGTFSVSQAEDNNTTNFIVKTSTNVGQIKIGFISENDYSYTLTYRVEDEDATEANRITTEDTTYTNDILTINEGGLNKIRQLDSSSGPKSKDISVLFTFTAENTNLHNFEIANYPVAVTLTHAQTFNDENAKSNFIEKALKKGSGEEFISETEGSSEKSGYSYSFTNGTLDLANKTFTITNATGEGTGTNEMAVAKSKIKTLADSTLKVSDSVSDIDISEITKSEFSKEEEGGDKKSYSLTYNITWADIYDLDITEITIKFENGKGFTDDTPTPTPPETTRNSRFSFVIEEKYFIKPEDNIKYI